MTQDLKTLITPPAGTVDVMIDLETLSTRPDAAIISIGACWFNAEMLQVGPPWHTRIDMADSIRSGGHVDGDTVRWWLQQSDAARASITEGCAAFIDDALQGLARYLHSVAPLGEVRVWGNGADFDLPILASAYARADLEQPWLYYNVRCLRTLRKLHPMVEAPDFEGTEHNAADDARHQAHHAIAILRAMHLQQPAPAVKAVQKVLDRMEVDGRLAYLIGPGSETFDLLCEALAAATGSSRELLSDVISARLNPQRVVIATQEG